MEEIGILALLEAKPGKGPDLHALLKSARVAAIAEQGTVNWFAFQISDTTYGIFDTFVDEDARIAHINGEIPKALGGARRRDPGQGPRDSARSTSSRRSSASVGAGSTAPVARRSRNLARMSARRR